MPYARGRDAVRAARGRGRAGARGHGRGRAVRARVPAGGGAALRALRGQRRARRSDAALPRASTRRRARPRGRTTATPATTCTPPRPADRPGERASVGTGHRGRHPGGPRRPGAPPLGSRGAHGISLVNAPGPDRRRLPGRDAGPALNTRPRGAVRDRAGRPDRPAVIVAVRRPRWRRSRSWTRPPAERAASAPPAASAAAAESARDRPRSSCTASRASNAVLTVQLALEHKGAEYRRVDLIPVQHRIGMLCGASAA